MVDRNRVYSVGWLRFTADPVQETRFLVASLFLYKSALSCDQNISDEPALTHLCYPQIDGRKEEVSRVRFSGTHPARYQPIPRKPVSRIPRKCRAPASPGSHTTVVG
jgi:hypothetical protein